MARGYADPDEPVRAVDLSQPVYQWIYALVLSARSGIVTARMARSAYVLAHELGHVNARDHHSEDQANAWAKAHFGQFSRHWASNARPGETSSRWPAATADLTGGGRGRLGEPPPEARPRLRSKVVTPLPRRPLPRRRLLPSSGFRKQPQPCERTYTQPACLGHSQGIRRAEERHRPWPAGRRFAAEVREHRLPEPAAGLRKGVMAAVFSRRLAVLPLVGELALRRLPERQRPNDDSDECWRRSRATASRRE
jgi:hypothetical protein